MTDNNKLNRPFASAIKVKHESRPRVVAQGYGELARQIEQAAKRNEIPVLKDFALSQQLSALGKGDEFPESLCFAIAVLFEYVLQFESQYGELDCEYQLLSQ
ncbi:MAG: EscU/YscU/HrcU family type III secretion system export apparatus switch protein [Gammaproteobacteria bacterium]